MRVITPKGFVPAQPDTYRKGFVMNDGRLVAWMTSSEGDGDPIHAEGEQAMGLDYQQAPRQIRSWFAIGPDNTILFINGDKSTAPLIEQGLNVAYVNDGWNFASAGVADKQDQRHDVADETEQGQQTGATHRASLQSGQHERRVAEQQGQGDQDFETADHSVLLDGEANAHHGEAQNVDVEGAGDGDEVFAWFADDALIEGSLHDGPVVEGHAVEDAQRAAGPAVEREYVSGHLDEHRREAEALDVEALDADAVVVGAGGVVDAGLGDDTLSDGPVHGDLVVVQVGVDGRSEAGPVGVDGEYVSHDRLTSNGFVDGDGQPAQKASGNVEREAAHNAEKDDWQYHVGPDDRSSEESDHGQHRRGGSHNSDEVTHSHSLPSSATKHELVVKDRVDKGEQHGPGEEGMHVAEWRWTVDGADSQGEIEPEDESVEDDHLERLGEDDGLGQGEQADGDGQRPYADEQGGRDNRDAEQEAQHAAEKDDGGSRHDSHRIAERHGMAADPYWLQHWIDRNGPYLYHQTRNDDAAQGILRNGLIPWDDPANPSGTIYDGDLVPRQGAVYLRSLHTPEDWRQHRLLHTFRVDLRKLDPERLIPDEDAMADVPLDMQEAWGFDEREGQPYGEWADANRMENPSQTAWSLERPRTQGIPRGTIAYRGSIPPEAIEYWGGPARTAKVADALEVGPAEPILTPEPNPNCKWCYGFGEVGGYPCPKCMKGKVPSVTDLRQHNDALAPRTPRRVRKDMQRIPMQDLRHPTREGGFSLSTPPFHSPSQARAHVRREIPSAELTHYLASLSMNYGGSDYVTSRASASDDNQGVSGQPITVSGGQCVEHGNPKPCSVCNSACPCGCDLPRNSASVSHSNAWAFTVSASDDNPSVLGVRAPLWEHKRVHPNRGQSPSIPHSISRSVTSEGAGPLSDGTQFKVPWGKPSIGPWKTYEPWEPGFEGKGMIDRNGTVYAWKVFDDPTGEAYYKGPFHPDARGYAFWISPDGHVQGTWNTWGPEQELHERYDVEWLADQYSGVFKMNKADDGWDFDHTFGSAGPMAGTNWTPGTEGKAIVFPDGVYSWSTENGSPSHFDFVWNNGYFDPEKGDVRILPLGVYSIGADGQLYDNNWTGENDPRATQMLMRAHPELTEAGPKGWSFSKTAGLFDGTFQTPPELPPYQRGRWAKGFLLDGQAYLWNAENDDHHFNGLNAVKGTDLKWSDDIVNYPAMGIEPFWVDFTGKVEAHDPEIAQQVAAAHPDFRYEPDEGWNFASAGPLSTSKVASWEQFQTPQGIDPWRPGVLGKGIVDTYGRAHAWEIDDSYGLDGYPAHHEYAEAADVDPRTFFTVYPDGTFQRLGFGEASDEQIMRAHLPQEPRCEGCGNIVTLNEDNEYSCPNCNYQGVREEREQWDWNFSKVASGPEIIEPFGRATMAEIAGIDGMDGMIPFVFGPRHIVMGEPGGYHAYIWDRIGTQSELGRQLETHGWVTSDGKIDSSQGAVPAHIKEAVEQYFGQPFENVGGGWSFGKVANLPPYAPWEKGSYGKGTVIDGVPHLWAVDDWGSPHHYEIANDLAGPDAYPEGYFHIHPDGQVEVQGPGDLEAFVAHDPRLKVYTGPEWNFAKVANWPVLEYEHDEDGELIPDETGTWDFSYRRIESPTEPWEPGSYGKGIIYDGQPYIWKIQGDNEQGAAGSPHHYEVADGAAWDMGYGAFADDELMENPIFVAPDGKIENATYHSAPDLPELNEKYLALHPSLYLSDGPQWNFSKTADTDWDALPTNTLREIKRLWQEHDPNLVQQNFSPQVLERIKTPPLPPQPTPNPEYAAFLGSCPNCGADPKQVRAYGYLGLERVCLNCHHEWQKPFVRPEIPSPAPAATHEIVEGTTQPGENDADAWRPNRRPFFHVPSLNRTYVGQGGASHYHLDQDFPFLSYNHENELQPGMVDHKIVTPYNPDTPDEILNDLANHYNVKVVPQMYNFSKTAQGQPQIEYMPDEASETLYSDEFTQDAYAPRRAFIYMPSENKVYIGSPGAHHNHVEKHFGLGWEPDRMFGMIQDPGRARGFGMVDTDTGVVRFINGGENAQSNNQIIDQIGDLYPGYERRYADEWHFGKTANVNVREVGAAPLEQEYHITGLEWRRPFLYEPSSATVFLGPPGAYHQQITDYVSSGDAIPGYVDLQDKTVEAYKPIPEVTGAVAQFLGPDYQAVTEPEWHFGKTANFAAQTPDVSKSRLYKTHHGDAVPWQKGLKGKGLIYQGVPYLWRAEQYDPHHPEVLMSLTPAYQGNNGIVNFTDGMFAVTPEGEVLPSIWDHGDREQFVASHPDLFVNQATPEWDFNSSVTSNLQLDPWEPGHYGKGIVHPDGSILHWKTQQEPSGYQGDDANFMLGGPHHGEVLRDLYPDLPYHEQVQKLIDSKSFWLHPNGDLEIQPAVTDQGGFTPEDAQAISLKIPGTQPKTGDMWSFGSIKTAHSLEWTPGQPGKAAIFGSIDQPILVSWNVDAEGNPHHYDIMPKNGIGNFIALEIKPDGEVSVLFGDPSAATDAAKIDPRLRANTNNAWNFSKVAALEVLEAGSGDGEWKRPGYEDSVRVDARPIIYIPRDHRLLVGKPGGGHQHLGEQFYNFEDDPVLGDDDILHGYIDDAKKRYELWSTAGGWDADEEDIHPEVRQWLAQQGYQRASTWSFSKVASPWQTVKDFVKPPLSPAPTPQEAAQGRMCSFHPDQPAVAAEGFAAMCDQCYRRWQQAQQIVYNRRAAAVDTDDPYYDPDFADDETWEEEHAEKFMENLKHDYSREEVERLLDEGWEPGQTGKAIKLDDGTELAWTPNEVGSPHHQQVAQALGITHLRDDQYFDISREGEWTQPLLAQTWDFFG